MRILSRWWLKIMLLFRAATTLRHSGCAFAWTSCRRSIRNYGFPFSQWTDSSICRFVANSQGDSTELSMENLYMEWTLEDDKVLYENRKLSTVELAMLLGRGLRGVESRLTKLRDVNSPAYEWLFASGSSTKDDSDKNDVVLKKDKLIPVSEVLRRIQWDYTLAPSDFSVLHYDRVDDAVVESPMDAPNHSIQGSQTQLIDALPEHRILTIKYKEQIVWDREERLDIFFSGEGIESVIANYDEWKQRKDDNEEWLRQRQRQVSNKVQQILGLERFAVLKTLSKQLESTLEDNPKQEAEKYVEASLNLFQQALDDPSASLEPALIPLSEVEAIECLSELVALSPNSQLRQHVLAELDFVLQHSTGNLAPSSTVNRELPEISEDDIEESFVRGSGPGGQKINKTNNKVVLLHKPTQLRVECQETRSLQQNRKIARKRLRLKLDEFLHGNQSRTKIKAEKAASKKAKAKARSRARNKRKKAAKEGGS